jgi:hypothetical protein
MNLSPNLMARRRVEMKRLVPLNQWRMMKRTTLMMDSQRKLTTMTMWQWPILFHPDPPNPVRLRVL